MSRTLNPVPRTAHPSPRTPTVHRKHVQGVVDLEPVLDPLDERIAEGSAHDANHHGSPRLNRVWSEGLGFRV